MAEHQWSEWSEYQPKGGPLAYARVRCCKHCGATENLTHENDIDGYFPLGVDTGCSLRCD